MHFDTKSYLKNNSNHTANPTTLPCSPLGVELSATHLDSRRSSIGKLEREEGICLH